MIYKTLCGKFTDKNTNGSTHYLGTSWGEDFGQELVHCPYKTECTHKTAFQEKYPAFATHNITCTCYKTEEKYNYEESLEKQEGLYVKIQNDYVSEKFGGWCRSMSADRYGKVKVAPNLNNCSNCWEEICIITKKHRDIEKTNIFVDKELVVKYGLITEQKIIKGIKLNSAPMPREIAVKIIEKPNEWDNINIFESNEKSNIEKYKNFEDSINNCEIISYKYYAKKSGARRNILEDLADIENGKTVVHESDFLKKIAEEKRVRREKYISSKKNKKGNVHQVLERLEAEKAQMTFFD